MRSRLTQSLSALPALFIGIAVTFCVYGYQFGNGNHGVYLLDALRRTDPRLLQNDWFTTHTLQYHIVFTQMAAMLMRLGIAQPGFAILYFSLLVLFHIAVRGIAQHFGGGDGTYLLAVGLYHLSAGGTGLGMYQFFQDSSLLPSNIANVAMLWAIWMWLIDRRIASGVWFGIAGIFHLNHALVGSGMWIALSLWPPLETARLRSKQQVIGTIAAIVPSGINIAYAAGSKLARSDAMPLSEFVDVYVRLRHPHHYDPSSWPIGIWAAFIWTMIPAIVLLRGQAIRIYMLMMFLIVVALIGAGMWYVNETLIQMSLYRFSIYAQLMGCVACAVLVSRAMMGTSKLDRGAQEEPSPLPSAGVPGEGERISALVAGAGICAAIIALCIARGPFFGIFKMPGDDADYRRLCEWVSANTPVDATLLVPPDEESMRLIGRRAIVVNYKCVPQLSAELREWQNRLCDVMNLRDLTLLPHDYTKIFPAMRNAYEHMPPGRLVEIARKYQARYIVATHPLEGMESKRTNIHATGLYILYDLAQ